MNDELRVECRASRDKSFHSRDNKPTSTGGCISEPPFDKLIFSGLARGRFGKPDVYPGIALSHFAWLMQPGSFTDAKLISQSHVFNLEYPANSLCSHLSLGGSESRESTLGRGSALPAVVGLSRSSSEYATMLFTVRK